MKRIPIRVTAVSLGVAALLAVAACSRNDPASYVASAKSYLAKSDYKSAFIQLKNAVEAAPNDGEARYLLAKTYLSTGDAVAAETEARKALDAKFDPGQVYPLLARALLAQGKTDVLLRDLAAVKLETTEGRVDLGTSIALASAARGDRAAAMTRIDAVLSENPSDTRALVTKAQFALQGGDYKQAADLIDKALAVAPNDAEALFAKAQLALAQKDSKAAVAALNKVIEANPSMRQARIALISLNVASKNVDAAQEQLDKLKQTAPGELGTLYAEALVANAKGDNARAKETLQKVLAAAPDHLPSLYLSGLVDAQLKSYASAEEALRKVMAKAPDDPSVRRTLASVYLSDGQPLAALEVLDPLMKAGTADNDVLRVAAEAYLASGNIKKGAEIYDRLSRADSTDVGGRVRLAQVRLASGDSDRAFRDLETIAQGEGSSQAELTLIVAHVQRREYDKALAALDALEKKQPPNSTTRNLRGSIYLAKRDFKAARATFEAALAAQPNDIAAASSLAVLDVQDGKGEDARKRFEAMVEKDPKNEGLLLAYAQVTALTRSNPEETKAIIDKAIAANPTSPRARVALVAYYARLGDQRSALSAAQAGQAALPSDPTVLEALAAAQLGVGEGNQAIATMQRLAQLQPSSPQAQLRLAAAQFAAQDFAGAAESARKATSLQPDFVQAWSLLVQANVRAGKADAALADARRLQKERPDSGLGYAMEADVMAAQKKWNEAAASIAEAMKRQPNPALAVTQYVVLMNGGRESDAKAVADKWIKQHPDDATMQEALAQAAMARKDSAGAIAQYRAILAINPESPIALNNLAWLLGEAGDPKAREYAERAYHLQPFNANVVDTLGWTLFRTGDTARGVKLLALASNLAPRAWDIRLHYAQGLAKTGDKAGAKQALAPLLALPAGDPQRAEAEKIAATL